MLVLLKKSTLSFVRCTRQVSENHSRFGLVQELLFAYDQALNCQLKDK